MNACTNCGASLDPDARFCQRCGTAVAGAPSPGRPAAAAHPSRRSRSYWWVVPAAIVLLVVVAWLVVAGLPFRRDEDRVEVTATGAVTETIAEAEPPPVTQQIPLSTASDIGYGTTTTQAPGGTIVLPETTAPPPAPQIPPPMISAQPAPSAGALPPPATQAPAAPEKPSASPEITEAEAAETLRRFLSATDYYRDVTPSCLTLRASGYHNEGFGFSVWDACAGGGGSRRLGLWRVDSHTGEVYVAKNGGRFKRP